MTSFPDNLMDAIIEIAEQASDAILEVYNSSFDIEQKDDNTPVTCADLAAHNSITDGLARLTPNIPVLSEESTNIPFSERKQWTTYWLVDPLDGTREFIKRNGEFTINIALIENNYPTLGVIYTPVTNTCFFAEQNKGAYKQVKGSEAFSISTRKAPVEKTLTASVRSLNDSSLDEFQKNIGKHNTISMGSSLKSCLIAEGKVDIYPRIGPTSEWDTAAAQCIIEEAGGCITTTDMLRLKYNTKESLLNPNFLAFGDKSIKWNEFL